jgi:hypothetical protein
VSYLARYHSSSRISSIEFVRNFSTELCPLRGSLRRRLQRSTILWATGSHFCDVWPHSIHRIHRTPPRELCSQSPARGPKMVPVGCKPTSIGLNSGRASFASPSCARRSPSPSPRLHWRINSLLESVTTGHSNFEDASVKVPSLK